MFKGFVYSHFGTFHCDSSRRIMLQTSTGIKVGINVTPVDMWWHTVTHGRGSKGKNWRMEWVASTLHTTSEHCVSSITTADAHTSAASSRLNWHPRRFRWTRPFRQKTKSGFCAFAITFQTQSTTVWLLRQSAWTNFSQSPNTKFH